MIQKSPSEQASNLAMALDILGNIGVFDTELQVLNRVFDTFDMLCSPSRQLWFSVADRKPYQMQIWPENDGSTLEKNEFSFCETILRSRQPFGLLEAGFWMRAGCVEAPVGVLKLEDLAFPEYRERYLNEVLNLNQIVALAISNARTYEQLRRTETALASEKRLLQITLRSIGEGVIVTDEQGKVTFLNPEAETMTGWSLEEAKGRSLPEIFRIIKEWSKEPCENPVELVLSGKKTVELANSTVLLDRNGKERIITDSAAPILKHDNIYGVVLVFRDVTKEKVLERTANRVNKLEAVGTLAGGIAHDFNNILTALIGNISLAMDYTQSGDELHEILSDAEQAIQSAQSLSQQLLTFSKGGTPVTELTPVATLIYETTRFTLRGSHCRYHCAIPEDLWEATIDKGQISQVLNNLLLNAIQAMPDGGVIEVSAENILNEAETQSLSLPHGVYIKVSVTDRGIGISPEHLDKIFDPFFTTKRKQSGLGLAISHSIIQNHRGHISVRSIVGKGTTFDFFLPASVATSEKKPTPELLPVAESPQRGKERILVMDDEPSILKIMRRTLTKLGYEITTTSHGQEALDAFLEAQATGRSFDAVILDLTIPGGIGGREVLQELLQHEPKIKAIASSGYSSDDVMASALSQGFVGVIPKPYTLKQVAEVLESVLLGT